MVGTLIFFLDNKPASHGQAFVAGVSWCMVAEKGAIPRVAASGPAAVVVRRKIKVAVLVQAREKNTPVSGVNGRVTSQKTASSRHPGPIAGKSWSLGAHGSSSGGVRSVDHALTSFLHNVAEGIDENA